MVISTESVWELFPSLFRREYEHAVVYSDAAGEEVLHEGPAEVLGNGWVELPSGRLLSPDAVHHIDRQPAD